MKKSWMTRKAEEFLGRLNGTNGNDDFWGDDGDIPDVDIRDVFEGRGGHDRIFGYDKGDRLSGGGGKDTIGGGNGRDKISGGSGIDTLSGGMHDDLITGGDGADVFFFDAWGPQYSGSCVDTITDFDPRQDGEQIIIRTLPYDGIATFADLKAIMVQDGDNVNMAFDGALAILVLEDVKIGQLREDDFHIYFG